MPSEFNRNRTHGFMTGLPPREPDWAGLFEATGQPMLAHVYRTAGSGAALAYILMEQDAGEPRILKPRKGGVPVKFDFDRARGGAPDAE